MTSWVSASLVCICTMLSGVVFRGSIPFGLWFHVLVSYNSSLASLCSSCGPPDPVLCDTSTNYAVCLWNRCDAFFQESLQVKALSKNKWLQVWRIRCPPTGPSLVPWTQSLGLLQIARMTWQYCATCHPAMFSRFSYASRTCALLLAPTGTCAQSQIVWCD